MANRFVRKTGSDANGGTSASDAWLTIGKAFGATGAASGDTIYVGAGTYREAVLWALTPSAMTLLIADVDGALTGDPGEVILTAYTTDDVTAPAASTTLNLNNKSNITVRGLTIIGGATANSGISFGSTGGDNIVIEDCTVIAAHLNSTAICILATVIASPTTGAIVRRCRIFGLGYGIKVQGTKAAADNDCKVTIENNVITVYGGRGIEMGGALGTGAGLPGGLIIRYNTVLAAGNSIHYTTTANWSITIDTIVRNNFLFCSTTGISAADAGVIDENYNRIFAPAALSNVTAGANSISTNAHAPLVELGQSFLAGRWPRPFLSPLAGSPLLGRGDDGTHQATVDLLNRPRPSGGASTSRGWGAHERHDAGRKGITLGADAGSGYLELVGPGDHDFQIPVDAAPTTITVRVKWDATHGDTNKPQASILHGGEVGWPDETKTAAGSQVGGIYETLTFTTRTPSKAGIVTLRLISRSAAGGGIAAFDSVAVTT